MKVLAIDTVAVAALTAILTGVAGIITAIASIISAKYKGSEECRDKLKVTRQEAELLAEELHNIRMKAIRNG